MIHHMSIAAECPQRVAQALAEIWQGKAAQCVHSFPPGTYVVFAGDEYGTSIEVFPLDTELRPGTAEQMGEFGKNSAAFGFTATHAAISVNASIEQIEQIAAREGWRAVRCSRGGAYDVIEFWLENRVMLELLTPEFSAQYAEAMQPQNIDAIVQFLTTDSRA